MSRVAADFEISDRAKNLLKVLVEHHISNGLPVGSKTLSQSAGINFSPATIRNIMAELEERGLIHSPHTSAGRVPTEQGYRLFVDSLLSVKPLNDKLLSSLKSSIREGDTSSVLSAATDTLSEITRMAGVVVLPKRDLVSLEHIEFVSLAPTRVLTILVYSDDEVQNRILNLNEPLSASQLQQMGNYLNQLFAGQDLQQVQLQLIQEMQKARQDMDAIMKNAITMASEALSEEARDESLLLSGHTNLMTYGEMSDLSRLHKLFEAFQEKNHLLNLLDHVNEADGVEIFIGQESGYEPFEDCSVIATPYQVNGQSLGVLGVIGPKRMAYDRVIPIVDITAKLVAAALKRES